jgi:Na+/H+ antiporter NhaD/arsenite permease-like protein
LAPVRLPRVGSYGRLFYPSAKDRSRAWFPHVDLAFPRVDLAFRMTQPNSAAAPRHFVPWAIVALGLLYGSALMAGWPQRGTQAVVAQTAEHAEPAAPGNGEAHVAVAAPPLWTVLPFMVMLGAIAVLPLIPATHHWWESNRSKLIVALGLALVVLLYYAFLHKSALEGHWPAHHVANPAAGAFNGTFVQTILENAILQEFVPFIVLLFALYSISGGIRIEGDLQADPLTNATFMAVGAVLASIIGTTGAAMLLIRPLLETNKERKHVAHTIVIFIFICCNCGGCLLPIGDPPLFLGFLEGVHFLWTLSLWKEWAFVNGMLLLTYVILDRFVFYHRETVADIERDIEQVGKLKFSGWKVNAPLLIGVVLAVALLDPAKPFLGTSWHPWLYLRELVQLVLVAISLWFGERAVREKNQFNFGAIIEVAALFIGIFICMQPALQILGLRGGELGINTPAKFFWASGSLSSVLDNAPTYLVFFKTAQGLPHVEGDVLEAGVEQAILAAISLGSVFMGAMTYIGNGPNFMVKAIAESSGVKMPSFFGYMAYSFAILLPILALNVWLFLM